jgi:hypothetical protein
MKVTVYTGLIDFAKLFEFAEEVSDYEISVAPAIENMNVEKKWLENYDENREEKNDEWK